MKLTSNADGSLRPDYPACVRWPVAMALRAAWNCIPAQWLVAACCSTDGSWRDRAVLWVLGQWPIWNTFGRYA